MELVRAPDTTFCIAVIGDFLGQGTAPSDGTPAEWVPRRATPESVMKLLGFRPRIRVGLGEGSESAELTFESLEDFDPGSLFRRLPFLEELREARENAKEGRPDGFPALDAPSPPAGSDGNPQETSAKETGRGEGAGSGLLDAILGQIPLPGSAGSGDLFQSDPLADRDQANLARRSAGVSAAKSIRCERSSTQATNSASLTTRTSASILE